MQSAFFKVYIFFLYVHTLKRSLSSFLDQFHGSFYAHINSKRVVWGNFLHFPEVSVRKMNEEHRHLATSFLQTGKIAIQTRRYSVTTLACWSTEAIPAALVFTSCFGDNQLEELPILVNSRTSYLSKITCDIN